MRNVWPRRWLRIPYKRDKPPTRTLETVGGNWINASLQIEVGIPIARFDNYWKVARRDDVAGRQAVWGYVARKMPDSSAEAVRAGDKREASLDSPRAANSIATKTRFRWNLGEEILDVLGLELDGKNFIFSVLEKISDRNSFWANQNYSESFRYLYPNQCESIRINPKKISNSFVKNRWKVNPT